jgi:hypothetical protein
VAVNSINGIDPMNEHLYLDDADDIRSAVLPANQPHQPHQADYDRMTIRMRAHALVAPNGVHRIRMVIADVNDARYDSGLFIKEGSDPDDRADALNCRFFLTLAHVRG